MYHKFPKFAQLDIRGRIKVLHKLDKLPDDVQYRFEPVGKVAGSTLVVTGLSHREGLDRQIENVLR
jgi:hypothetical protein